LAYTFSDKYEALSKAEEILKFDNKEHWSQKRIHMLNDKVNTVSFMVDVIENYGKTSK
jgi:ATP-dependent Clp protease adapter protein ClpS